MNKEISPQDLDSPKDELLDTQVSSEEVGENQSENTEVAANSFNVEDLNLDDPSLGRWYILHTYSGFEQRVEQTIREMMRLGQDEGAINDVIVPTEKVMEVTSGGKKRTTTRKFYPGYVMIRMTMTDFAWHLVQNIPKVTGFIGGKNRPAPMKPSEAKQILSLMQERQEQPRPKFNFSKGDTIRVIDGPFSGFDAVVEDVNHDKGKLKVSISIFGRQTTVELDFLQIAQS